MTADDRMLLAARRGDGRAQASALRQWQDRWFHLALAYLGSVPAARDAVYETALRTLLTLPQWVPPTDANAAGELPAATWLLRTSVDVLRDAAGGFPQLDRVRRAGLPTRPAVYPPAAAAAESLATALGPVQGTDRLAVILRGLDEQPPEVVAAALRVTGVRGRVRAAVALLREQPKPRPTIADARRWYAGSIFPGDLRSDLFRRRKPSWIMPLALGMMAVSLVLLTVGNRFHAPLPTSGPTTNTTRPATR